MARILKVIMWLKIAKKMQMPHKIRVAHFCPNAVEYGIHGIPDAKSVTKWNIHIDYIVMFNSCPTCMLHIAYNEIEFEHVEYLTNYKSQNLSICFFSRNKCLFLLLDINNCYYHM